VALCETHKMPRTHRVLAINMVMERDKDDPFKISPKTLASMNALTGSVSENKVKTGMGIRSRTFYDNMTTCSPGTKLSFLPWQTNKSRTRENYTIRSRSCNTMPLMETPRAAGT
jgi:hypothetical protein